MAKVVVYGAATMDFSFHINGWLQPNSQIEGTVSSEPGGKGLTQAVACSRLDAETTLISGIGDDAYGQAILRVLRDEYVKPCLHVEPLPVRRDIITDITGVFVNANDGSNGYIGCRNATDKLTPEFVESEAAAAIEGAQAVLVTFDANLEAAQKAIQMSKQAHKYTVVNFSPPVLIPLHAIDGVDYVIASGKEARIWLRQSGVVSDSDLSGISDVQVGEQILNRGARNVIVICDRQEYVIVNLQGARTYTSFLGDLEIDPTGAQEAFCSGIAVTLAKHSEAQRAPLIAESELMAFAAATRTVACSQAGAVEAMPTLATVRMFLAQRPALQAEKHGE